MKKNILSRWFSHVRPATDGVQLRDGLSVLIVDDSRTQLYALQKMLNAEGVKTYTAENGRQGILMARHVKPDLILMDIVMPEINGFQATRYLSKQQDTAHIPIVIISGSEEQSDKVWAIKLGARDYIQKPADRMQLLQKVSRWTAEVGVSRPVAESKAAAPQSETARVKAV